jgi:hypothetical protein
LLIIYYGSGSNSAGKLASIYYNYTASHLRGTIFTKKIGSPVGIMGLGRF